MTIEQSAPIPPKPPKRPVTPPVTAPSPASAVTKQSPSNFPDQSTLGGVRYHPIAPPDTPMQFRAVGVVAGRYVPSEEQFTRGTLITPDGENINAVLLGRVMSLVRKYIQDDRDYLWVVYPRTGLKSHQDRLHVQISGVWAPEEMGPIGEDLHEQKEKEAGEPEETVSPPKPPPTDVTPDLFSIRGEVVRQKPEEDSISVKIVQSARKKTGGKKASSFKLTLKGTIPTHALGGFWEFEVRRQGSLLEIVRAVSVGRAPKPKPKKHRKGAAGHSVPRPHKGGDEPHKRPAPPKPRRSSSSS